MSHCAFRFLLSSAVIAGFAFVGVRSARAEDGAFRNYCLDTSFVAPALRADVAERAALLAELATIRRSYAEPTVASDGPARFARAQLVKQRLYALNARICADVSADNAAYSFESRTALRQVLEARLARLNDRVMALKVLMSNEPERSGEWMEEWDGVLGQRMELETRIHKLSG